MITCIHIFLQYSSSNSSPCRSGRSAPISVVHLRPERQLQAPASARRSALRKPAKTCSSAFDSETNSSQSPHLRRSIAADALHMQPRPAAPGSPHQTVPLCNRTSRPCTDTSPPLADCAGYTAPGRHDRTRANMRPERRRRRLARLPNRSDTQGQWRWAQWRRCPAAAAISSAACRDDRCCTFRRSLARRHCGTCSRSSSSRLLLAVLVVEPQQLLLLLAVEERLADQRFSTRHSAISLHSRRRRRRSSSFFAQHLFSVGVGADFSVPEPSCSVWPWLSESFVW